MYSYPPSALGRTGGFFFFVTDLAATASEDVCRVGVFVDWQNCYRRCREALQFAGSSGGMVKPLALARILAAARLPEQGEGELVKVRIYTGRASQDKDRKTYAANRRHFQAWKNADPDKVEVIARTLDYKLGKPREKGIDVALAIDLVRTALFEEEFQVAVVVSVDTDLLPALELLVERKGLQAVEVAAWQGLGWSPAPLAIAGSRVRVHELTKGTYDKVCDLTDYNIQRDEIVQAKFPYGRRPRRR